MTASFLLLSSAFLHALWNAFAKKSSQPAIHLIGIMICAGLFSLLFIPLFSEPAFFTPSALVWTIGAGLCEAGYLVCLAITLERLPIGPAYTIMRGGAMILVWIGSVTAFGEEFYLTTAAGILVVLGGLLLTSSAHAHTKLKPEVQRNFSWAYGCAIFIAGYHICYHQALEFTTNPAALFSLSIWIAIPFLFLLARRSRLSTLKHQFVQNAFPFVMGGLVCAISFLLFLVALRQSGAGYALTLRNSSVIFAQGFALAIGETVTKRQWLGALLVAVGAALVAS